MRHWNHKNKTRSRTDNPLFVKTVPWIFWRNLLFFCLVQAVLSPVKYTCNHLELRLWSKCVRSHSNTCRNSCLEALNTSLSWIWSIITTSVLFFAWGASTQITAIGNCLKEHFALHVQWPNVFSPSKAQGTECIIRQEAEILYHYSL